MTTEELDAQREAERRAELAVPKLLSEQTRDLRRVCRATERDAKEALALARRISSFPPPSAA